MKQRCDHCHGERLRLMYQCQDCGQDYRYEHDGVMSERDLDLAERSEEIGAIGCLGLLAFLAVMTILYSTGVVF